MKKGFLGVYTIEIDSVHLNSVDGFAVKDLSFVDKTDTLKLSLGGINIDMDLTGKATAMWLIPC